MPQLLSVTEAQAPRAGAPQQEKPLQSSLCTARKGSPGSPQLEKAHVQQRRPSVAKK